MAKKCKIVREEQRAVLVARHAEKRKALRKIVKSAKATDAERERAYAQLRALPRDSSPTRVRNRCQKSGRPRGVLRRFGLSRIALREMALEGYLPGVRKASW